MTITFVVDSYNVAVHLRCPWQVIVNHTLAAVELHLPIMIVFVLMY